MFKSTIIAIILFMMSLTAGAATTRVLTQADFIQLSPAQKDEYVIKLMELAIELESRYETETAQNGYNQDRFEKYTKILRTLKSVLFIDSAYALNNPLSSPSRDKDSSWHQLAVNFNSLMKNQRSTDGKTKDDNCIFAGWVSRVIYIEKDGKRTATCTHPDFVDGTDANRHKKVMAPESKGYPDPAKNSNCPVDDKNWIQCNPVIFGYKNEEKKSLFCVLASDGAHNSSYNCMQHALSDKEVPGVDSKAKRLEILRNRLASKENEDVFKEVWEFTYKTCVCPKVASSKFNQDYQNYMRPHRTCYGLMEMMSATAQECSATVDKASPFPTTDTALFKELKSQINRNELKSEASADTAYQGFLDSLVKKNNPDYLRLCSLQPEKPVEEVKKDYKCSAECKPDEAKKVTCKYSISVDGKPAELEKEAEGAQPKDGEKQVSVKFKPKNGKEETLACDIPQPEVPKETPKTLSCSGNCETTADDKIECTYKLSDGSETEIKASFTKPDVKAEDNGKEVEVKFKLEGSDKEETKKCSMTITPKKAPDKVDPKKLACSGDCKTEMKDGKPSLSCSYTFKDGDKIVNPKFDQPKVEIGATTAKISYTAEGSSDKQDVDCALTMSKPTAPTPAKTPSGPMSTNGNGMQQMPQVPIRGTSDTSAIGIK